MDQIRKFGEQTSQILEFKPKGLDFQSWIRKPGSLILDKETKESYLNERTENSYIA